MPEEISALAKIIPSIIVLLILGAIVLPRLSVFCANTNAVLSSASANCSALKGPVSSSVTGTLSRVMTSCLLTSIVTTRRSIFTIRKIQTDPWGIKVTAVEVKDVVLPDGMKRAMAKQAEAERERRAKIVNAEGEFQAAEKMVQAAAMMSREPMALQLRFLQTMREISSEHNTTTFLPVPIDLFGPFVKGATKD